MVTGSTLGDAAGFNGLSTRRALYDTVHFGKSLPPTSVEVQKAMTHGTKMNLMLLQQHEPTFFQYSFLIWILWRLGSLKIHHIHPLILMLMKNVSVSLLLKSFLCFPWMVFLFQGNPPSCNLIQVKLKCVQK